MINIKKLFKQLLETLSPNNRITPENITTLKSNEIFVFGSNTGGFHGAGAASMALAFGAKMRKGVGLFGQTYAIPTKKVVKNGLVTMSLEEIRPYVLDFIDYAYIHPNKIFLVTQIGCGLAGYKPSQIAPLFKRAINVENIYLPQVFWDELNR